MSTTRQIHSLLFDSLPSTNTWIKENIASLDPQGLTCLIAKTQTAGRGQFERKWISQTGNLFASFYFTTEIKGGNWAQLLSLSCVSALQKKEIFCHLKWPNDLLLQGKKVGGILCETVSLENRTGVILGLGLNCSSSPQNIDQPATSISEELQKPCDATEICYAIITQFLNDLKLFEQRGFAPFHPLYSHFLNLKPGDPLSIRQGATTLIGTFHGIDLQGRLLLEKEGILTPISSGQIQKHLPTC